PDRRRGRLRRGLHGRTGGRERRRRGGAPRLCAGRRPAEWTGAVRASVQTAAGVYLVDLEDDSVLGPSAEAEFDPPPPAKPFLPRLVAASGAGSTGVALVAAKTPPLVRPQPGRTRKE